MLERNSHDIEKFIEEEEERKSKSMSKFMKILTSQCNWRD